MFNFVNTFDFANTEAIKEKVRHAKLRPPQYNVHDCYHETGFFQWLAKHPLFENVTLGIIVLNALWLAFDTDGNTAETILNAEAVYIAADTMFFSYFSVELFVRFMAFKRKLDGFKDPWFAFDTTLVTLYAFDPFCIGLMAALSGGGGLDLPTAILRLFRLARLSRLVRMLRSLPELMIMIKGMITATASVSYCVLLLLIVTYIFAIALRNLVPVDSEIEENYFSTVPETMHNLMVYGTLLDALSDFFYDTKNGSPACFILCWIYCALSALTVMNMLIGVLCEVISAVAAEEKESMMVEKVNEKFHDIVKELDTDGSGNLSWAEFQEIMENKQALTALDQMNVDPEAMIDMAEDFFFDEGEGITVSFSQFMEMVLDLRGGQEATVGTILTLGKRLSRKFMNLKTTMGTFDESLSKIDKRLDDMLVKEGKKFVEPPYIPQTPHSPSRRDIVKSMSGISGSLKSVKSEEKPTTPTATK